MSPNIKGKLVPQIHMTLNGTCPALGSRALLPCVEHQEVFLEDSGQWDIKSLLVEVRVTQILHLLPNK